MLFVSPLVLPFSEKHFSIKLAIVSASLAGRSGGDAGSAARLPLAQDAARPAAAALPRVLRPARNLFSDGVFLKSCEAWSVCVFSHFRKEGVFLKVCF